MPFRYVTARWVGCLKVVAAVLVAGLAGGCALVMARIDAKLVNSGLVVVADVKVGASLAGGAELVGGGRRFELGTSACSWHGFVLLRPSSL